jgi:hypothetical protein
MAKDGMKVKGTLNIKLVGPDGEVKLDKNVNNLITTVGDKYYAQMGCAGVGGNSAPTLAYGMQVGTSTTAVAKSSTGSAIGSFIANSGVAFDTVTAAVVSGDTGWKITYVAEFGAGTGTGTIQEAVITTETNSNTASVENKTIARVLTGAISKGAADTLTLTWVHTFYDAA